MSWKAKEEWMHNYLKDNVECLNGMTMCKNGVSSFDAFDDDRVIEYKYRSIKGNEDYPDQLLEKDKLNRLLEAAYLRNKRALYITYSNKSKTFRIFNLSKLYEDKYEWNFNDEEHNTSTHFKNTNKRTKSVCYLPNELAVHSITVEQ